MKAKLISFAKYLFLLGIGLFLLWLTFRHEDLRSIYDKIKNADIRWILLSLFFSLLAFLSRAYRWNMLIEPLGFKPKLTSTSYSLMVGYFANLAIPRIGEITRCGSLSKAENIPFNILIGTVIIERVIDLAMLAFSILIVASLEFDIMSGFLSDNLIYPLKQKFYTSAYMWLFLLSIMGILLLTIYFLKKKVHVLRKKAWYQKVEQLIGGVLNGVRTVVKMKRNGLFVFHTFFIWIMYFFMTYSCFFALESTKTLGVKAGMFVLVIGGLGMSAPVQGGIGAYHWIVSQGLLLFDIKLTDGIVFATLVHTYQTIQVILLGLLSMILLATTSRKKGL